MPSKWWFSGWAWRGLSRPQKPRLEKADFTAGVGTWNEIQAGKQDDGKMAAIRELPEGLDWRYKTVTHTHTLNHIYIYIWVFPQMVVLVPPKHPKMIILAGKPMCVGCRTILGNPHIYIPGTQMTLVLNGVWAFFGRVQTEKIEDISRFQVCRYIGVSKNRGTPKWMVYDGKPYQNGWFGGTTIFGNIHITLPKHTHTDLPGLFSVEALLKSVGRELGPCFLTLQILGNFGLVTALAGAVRV